MKEKFDVQGMTCSACSSYVEREVSRLEGVEEVSVSLLTNSMIVNHDDRINNEEIITAVKKAGYGATIASTSTYTEDEISNNNLADRRIKSISQITLKTRLVISLIFMIPLFYVSMGHMMGLWLPKYLHDTNNSLIFALLQLGLALPVVIVNYKYFTKGIRTLLKGAPNMDTLIAIGSMASIVYGIYAIVRIAVGLADNDINIVKHFSMDLYFESGAMILTLITLGKLLEARSKGKTSDTINKLIKLTPQTATIIRNNEEVTINTSEVVLDDIVVIRPGQNIPVDGVVVEGSSAVNESMITGESLPVDKQIDDSVIGGTTNQNGYLKIRASKIGDDSTLYKIIRLVEEAASSKAPIAKMADKVSGIFVPIVLVIAVLSIITWLIVGENIEFALSIGIAVLVISCPCALGLATPTAIMVGTGKAAENKVLFKSAESLENMHRVNTIVLDKTGTITEGKMKVTDIWIENSGELLDVEDDIKINYTQKTNDNRKITVHSGNVKDEVIRIIAYAAAAEMQSEHPLANAVTELASEICGDIRSADSFEMMAGKGIKATIQDENITILAGNKKMMDTNNIDIAMCSDIVERFAQTGKTPIFVAINTKLEAIFAIADVIKSTSKAAVNMMKQYGLEVIMLTGDNEITARNIADLAGIDNVIAGVMPQDKEKVIRNLMTDDKKVAMVGDGINDAPALTRADVGIAIGSGTDVAIEAADVVLMRDDLGDCVKAYELSKATIKNIKENLFWAFFYNTIGIPIAAGVLYTPFGIKLNPMIAAAAMSLSSVFVVTNALRLRYIKLGSKEYKPEYKVEDKTEDNVGYSIEDRILNDSTNIEDKENYMEDIMKKTINIEGMSCMHCVNRVKNVLMEIDGVTEVEVSLEGKSADITLDKDVDTKILKDAVKKAGYEA